MFPASKGCVMENEVRQPELPPAPTLPTPSRTPRRLAVLAACLVLFAGGYALVRWSLDDGEAGVGQPTDEASRLFVGWSKPDFALLISGQTFGYLQPCGCSHPQYGGLARRWEFMNGLRSKGWQVVPLDVGDIYPNQKSLDTPAAQNLLKYETAMRALHAMGYHVVGIGKQELGVPLTNALAQYSLNNPRPRPVAVNLVGVEKDGVFEALNARPYEIIEAPGLPKIGVLGVIGKTVQDSVKGDPSLKFLSNVQVLPGAFKDLHQQTGFNVMLFQTDDKTGPGGGPEVEQCVTWCSQQRLAPLHVVIHTTDEPEPPGAPRDIRGTQVITIGHKGKYVGVLGVWRKGNHYEYKYEIALIGPEYDPKPGNPVSKLMEDYAKRVMDQNLMTRFLFTPHKTQVLLKRRMIESKYVGSETCARCHEHAHDIWDKSGHAHAFKTLEEAENPGLRQHDGECVQCHTVGFKHDWGYNDPRHQAKMKLLLRDVGCESCHGPASAHVNNPQDVEIHKLINPWAKRHNPTLPEHVRLQRINTFCQSCHDIENDVHWNFEKKWPAVIHMTPK
jgi:hypothetical protein